MMNSPEAIASPLYERRALCRSVGETERLAAAFAVHLSPGAFVAMTGSLGAGKSVVARAIGATWGVVDPMPSPTYTIMAVHQGRVPIYHMDLYRLGSVDELDFAGLRSYFQSDGLCLVEWAERARDAWPSVGWTINIEVGDGDNRLITVSSFGRVT
jgi:tRNA threonylcarbamoyladenosine biosynthesis protein TsaE